MQKSIDMTNVILWPIPTIRAAGHAAYWYSVEIRTDAGIEVIERYWTLEDARQALQEFNEIRRA